MADISDLVSDYSIYTPEMILSKVEVRKGDILIVNTGYHKYSYDQPDVVNPHAQGGVEFERVWLSTSATLAHRLNSTDGRWRWN